MDQRILRQGLMLCLALLFLCLMGGNLPSAEAYKNYTVGGPSGWFDKQAKLDVDYDKWATGKTFSLGDFLIFNTDSNHSVIQTRNVTTYDSCDSQGDDDILWSATDPNSTVVRPITVAVPLLREGPSYFFSGDYDGEQCLNGQKLAINVTRGQGLPPTLRDNPDLASGPSSPEAPGPAGEDSGDGNQSAPDTVVSSDFNHPKNVPPQDSGGGESEEGGDAKAKPSGATSFMPIRDLFFACLIAGSMFLLGIF